MKELSDYSEQELLHALDRVRTEKKNRDKIATFKQRYPSPVGWWGVSTEGDCEGKTIKKLGVHHGHVLDIAAKLANQAGYELKFSAIDEPKDVDLLVPDKTQVYVALNIDSKTWDIKGKDRENVIADWLTSELAEETILSETTGTSYAGVRLIINKKK